MNRPIAGRTARTDTPAPAVLVPKPSAPPLTPTAPHPRRIWLIGGLLSLAVLAAAAVAWWLSGSGAVVNYTCMGR